MLKAKITKIENETMTLQLPDGQSLALPLQAVEGEGKPGQEAALLVVSLGGEEAGRQELARHLLNELLKG